MCWRQGAVAIGSEVGPQMWATFWHYTILNTMFDRKLVTDQFMLEFLHSHTNVVYQPSFNSKYFSGINPYTLGFAMFIDIRRICENPTTEDKRWFPDLAGSDWLESIHFAMQNFKDESFIAQYLSPKVIRDLKLFALVNDDNNVDLEIEYIHNEDGYQKIRELLSEQYNLSKMEPNIQIYDVDVKGDRSLTLRHTQQDRIPLSNDTEEVLKHFHKLWGFDIKLETVDADGKVDLVGQCPVKEGPAAPEAEHQ